MAAPALAQQIRSLSSDDKVTLLRAVENSPDFFTRRFLGHDHWEVPQRIFRDLTKPRARVAVKGCNAAAKTFSAADLVLWWTIKGGITITTAPTFRQVQKTMWPAVRNAHMKALFPLGGKMLQTEFQIAPDIFALGMSTDSGVNALGFHGQILIVIDEAPGIGTGIFDAVRGIRAGGDVRVLMLGNPDVEGGPYSDAFKSEGWNTYTISAFDTPNLTTLKKRSDEPWQETLETLLQLSEADLDIAPRPYLATRRWVKEMYEECSIESPLWESRVLAEFPQQSQSAAYPMAWLEAAKKRVIESVPADEDWQAGIDVAEDGEDETVLYVRHGPRIIPGFPKAWTKASETVQGEVIAELLPFKDKKLVVAYDAIGVGAYFATPLRQAGLKCIGVKVSESPRNKGRFHRKRDELGWALRERMKPDENGHAQIAGLTDVKTFRQLANVRYSINTQGQIVIESKDSMRERGAKSPDRGDGLILCFAPFSSNPLDHIR